MTRAQGLSNFASGLGNTLKVDDTNNRVGINSSIPTTTLDVGGSVTATSGTFTGDVDIADKIIHTGDTNTAIRFPAADTFAVETAGSERLRITSAGLVGIGTDNPLNGLDVRGDILIRSSTPNFKLQSANGSNPYYLAANISDVVDGGVQIGKGSDLNTGTSLLTLLSNGNAGVGTNNPQDKLHIRGPLRVDGGSSTTFNNNYSKIYQNSSASVDYGLQLTHYQGDTGHQDSSIIIGGNGSTREGNITFRRSNGSGGTTESMRIDENGNATFAGSVHIAEASTNTGGDINANADGLVVDNSGGNTGLTFKTPNTASSRICFGDPEDNNAGQILYNHSDNSLAIDTSGSERMSVNNAGNIGINQTNPEQKLHVVGNVQINGGVLTSLLTSVIADDAYEDVVMPVKGGIIVITSFTTYDTYSQPNGTGLIYYDAGDSKNASVLVDASNTLSTSIDASTTAGTFTDGRTTIAMINAGTIRIWNRMNTNRRYKITLL
jgi:hypothetical protein